MTIYQQIKQSVSLSELAVTLGLKQASQHNGKNMFHGPGGNGNTPSLSIRDDEGCFIDFAQDAKGDHVELVMHVMKIDKSEAIKWLCDQYNIQEERENNNYTQKKKSLSEWLAHEAIKQAKDARLMNYLTSRRIKETVIQHAIAKSTLGFTDYTKSGKPPGSQGYHGPAVVFIVKSINPQRIVGIEKRFIDATLNGGQKMNDSDGIGGCFWCSDYSRIKKSHSVFIVESPINALSIDCCEMQGCVAIATLGVRNIDLIDWRFLRGKNVYLGFDKDAAKKDGSQPGQETNWKMYDKLTDLGICVHILDQSKWVTKIKNPLDDEEDEEEDRKNDEEAEEFDIDINDMLQGIGVVKLKKRLRIRENWLISGVRPKASKNRAWLPSVDMRDYWRFRTTAEHTEFLKTVKEKDDSGTIQEREVEVDVCGFRIANFRTVSVASNSSAVNGGQDDSPRVFFVAYGQNRRGGRYLSKQVFEQGIHNPGLWENKLGAIYDVNKFKRAVTIMENTAALNPIHAANIVGLAWLNNQLSVNEGNDCFFAIPEQQCAAYKDLTFHTGPPSEAKIILNAYRSTFTNNAALLMLLWTLGSHLKIFSGFYPHLLTQADKGVGKSQIIEKIGMTAVLSKYTAEDLTPYRLKILCSGTTFPIAFDEFSNAKQDKREALSNTMQNTYTKAIMSSQTHGMTLEFLKIAPLLIGGEDVADADNVLTKTVRVTLDMPHRGAEIDPHDLPKWPMKQWLEFLAGIERQQFNNDFESAHAYCKGFSNSEDQLVDRMVKNYAVLLLAWRYVAAFADIQDTVWSVDSSIVTEMNRHIGATDADREPWVKVIDKITLDIQTNQYPYPYNVSFIHDEGGDLIQSLNISAAHMMDYVKTSPNLREFRDRLPISSKKVLTHQLQKSGVLVKKHHPTFSWKTETQRHTNFMALSVVKLQAYGITVPGADYGDCSDEMEWG